MLRLSVPPIRQVGVGEAGTSAVLPPNNIRAAARDRGRGGVQPPESQMQPTLNIQAQQRHVAKELFIQLGEETDSKMRTPLTLLPGMRRNAGSFREPSEASPGCGRP